MDYDFLAFVRRQTGRDHLEILAEAERTCAEAERGLYGGKGGPARRAAGGDTFVMRLKEFLYWLRTDAGAELVGARQ